jgi:hypothetical protein
LAYELIKKLTIAHEKEMLQKLAADVTATDKVKGKLHEVFQPSFDCKECFTEKIIVQKLVYMHANPCKGIWQLANSPIDYKHSSALFYSGAEVEAFYPVTHYMQLEDIYLSK